MSVFLFADRIKLLISRVPEIEEHIKAEDNPGLGCNLLLEVECLPRARRWLQLIHLI